MKNGCLVDKSTQPFFFTEITGYGCGCGVDLFSSINCFKTHSIDQL